MNTQSNEIREAVSDAGQGVVHDPDSENHFEVLGIPRRLVADTDEVTRRYYEMSRIYHPDRHQDAPVAERIQAINRTANVNKAYQVLRDPFERGKWWLEYQGEELGRENNQVPGELMILVLEIQELLEQARSRADSDVANHVEEHRADVESERDARLERLQDNFARWDNRGLKESPELLVELKQLLSELSYLRTLLRDINRTLESVSDS